MFSQYPSNDRWYSWLPIFPDGQELYKAASIVIGPLHSLPLNLKYHLLHLLWFWILVFPWNETLSAEEDCSLLNAQSWNKIEHTADKGDEQLCMTDKWSSRFPSKLNSCSSRETANRKPQFTVTRCSFKLPRFEISARRSLLSVAVLFSSSRSALL